MQRYPETWQFITDSPSTTTSLDARQHWQQIVPVFCRDVSYLIPLQKQNLALLQQLLATMEEDDCISIFLFSSDATQRRIRTATQDRTIEFVARLIRGDLFATGLVVLSLILLQQ